MKKVYFILLIFLGISITTIAQSINISNDIELQPHPRLQNAILDAEVIPFEGNLLDLLDQTFDSLTSLSDIKGFNAAMIFEDGNIWKRASGLAIEFPFPQGLTTEHLMGMGSISKTFVSTCLLLLMEDGLISLDDPIGMFLPAYPNISGDISVRQILSHTSGLNDYLNENANSTLVWSENLDSVWTIDTVLNNFVLAPNFDPGTSWSYSNTNYLLAGRLIEELTGLPWYEVVRARIIDPLALDQTFVFPWESYNNNQLFAHVFADIDGDGNVDDLQGIGISMDGLFSLASSAGCLISTPEDIALFNKNLFSGQILKASTLQEMQQDYIMGPNYSLQYGLGAASFPFGIENWGHNGSIIYNSLALYFPEEGISFAIQQNDSRLNGNPGEVIDIYSIFAALLVAYQAYVPLSSYSETSNQNEISIYPNPTDNELYINLKSTAVFEFPVDISLIDASGKLVFQSRLEQKNQRISLKDYPDGLYYFRIGDQIHKVIIDSHRE